MDKAERGSAKIKRKGEREKLSFPYLEKKIFLGKF